MRGASKLHVRWDVLQAYGRAHLENFWGLEIENIL